MNETWTVSLPRYEGPLDLLLALVRNHEVPIAEIAIAEITGQYLDYLHAASELDINLGGDFAFMAATLILIKSRSLLPKEPESEGLDLREELVRELLDYEHVRQAADFLEKKLEENGIPLVSPMIEESADSPAEAPPSDGAYPPGSMSLLDILRLAERAVEIAKSHRELEFRRETVTFEEILRWLEGRIAKLTDTPLLADELFREQKTLAHKIALFLALLEISRTGGIHILQQGPFEAIQLAKADSAAASR